jgi:outer membrane lipase/esterase
MRLNVIEVRRAVSGCSLLAAALLLASCGGGTQSNTFTPSRIIALGDETSVIDDSDNPGNGSKYSVNATALDQSIDCHGFPIWTQTVGSTFGGIVFPQCNPGPTPVDSPPSRIRATFGAKAADVAAQIDAQAAESPIGPGDLVTLLVGVNDVLEQYAQYPSVSEPILTANVQAAGTEVARQVNRLADAGAKVVISTIPDVGYSPFAFTEKMAHIDIDRQALIIRLVSSFNTAMRSTITNDGHRIGLVTMDELVESVAVNPGLDGFNNLTDGVCDLGQSALTPPSILDCTNLTLISNGSATSYLWADDRHLSAGGQLSLGNLAATRARNNPF